MVDDRKRPIRPAPSTTPTCRPKKEAASRVSIACEACKRRKSRCAGRPPPCQMCKTLDTECVIDATLDHRRKISAKRLAGRVEVQKELLLSILQCVRHGQQSDILQLRHCLRTATSSATVAEFVLQQSSGLDPAGRIPDTEFDELLDSYAVISRQCGSDDGSTFNASRRSSVSSTVTTETELEPVDRASTPDIPQRLSPRQSLRRTHERWSKYVQMHLLAVRIDPVINSTFAYPTKNLKPIESSSINTRLMQPEVLSSPSLEEPPICISLFDKRAFWHPALKFVSTSETTSPISIGVVDFETQNPHESPNTTIGLSSHNDNESYIEILRSFPSAVYPSSSDTVMETDHFKTMLQLSRFAIHSVQPLNRYENSPLSRVITDYREAARKFITEGNSPLEVLGADGVEVDLLFREREESDESCVSNWASEIWRSFSDWDIYVRLSHVLFYTHVMRWTLIPTSEQYHSVPPILLPTPLQRLVPHHPALDFIPFPPLRDGLIRNLRDWKTELPLAGISVNWAGKANWKGMESAIYRDEITGQLKITREFEQHVTDLKNWSIGRSALGMFPELAECGIKIMDDY